MWAQKTTLPNLPDLLYLLPTQQLRRDPDRAPYSRLLPDSWTRWSIPVVNSALTRKEC